VRDGANVTISKDQVHSNSHLSVTRYLVLFAPQLFVTICLLLFQLYIGTRIIIPRPTSLHLSVYTYQINNHQSGEISEALEKVWGRHIASTQVVQGAYSATINNNSDEGR
jgi:hypothetical protein